MNNEDTNKLIQVGTFDKPEWIEARRRVYSSENVAMACLAQPVGNTGGFSYLYLIDDTYKNREPRLYDKYSPSIRAERQGFKVITNE